MHVGHVSLHRVSMSLHASLSTGKDLCFCVVPIDASISFSFLVISCDVG